MNPQIEEAAAGASGKFDTALLGGAVALLAGGLFAFYYFQTDFNVLIRTLMLLGAIAAGAAVAYQSQSGKNFLAFVAGSRTELRKVVWPTRQESVQTTLMIAVVVLIAALLLWGLDSLLLWGVKMITGRG